jgi:hypothetical protein
VIIIRVINATLLGPGLDGQESDARTVTEKVQLLDVTGIVEATAFIRGDENAGARP